MGMTMMHAYAEMSRTRLFDSVKSLSEDAVTESLRDKCLGVYALDVVEHILRLIFARQHHQHMHIVLGVPSGALEQGDTAIDVLVDGISNLLVFLGNDEELHRLPGTVDDVVARDAGYERKGDTIDDDFGTVV